MGSVQTEGGARRRRPPPTEAAAEPQGSGHTGTAANYLSFMLGAEMFAMDIRSVREIIQVGSMTPVPLMPTFVRGVINLRGAVVPVIDPHARFGWPSAKVGKKTCIVIFDAVPAAGAANERVELGLMVDAVNAVVEMADAALEEAPDFGSTVRRDFIRGVGKLGQRFVVILEPAKAFDLDDMAAHCESAQAALAA